MIQTPGGRPEQRDLIEGGLGQCKVDGFLGVGAVHVLVTDQRHARKVCERLGRDGIEIADDGGRARAQRARRVRSAVGAEEELGTPEGPAEGLGGGRRPVREDDGVSHRALVSLWYAASPGTWPRCEPSIGGG